MHRKRMKSSKAWARRFIKKYWLLPAIFRAEGQTKRAADWDEALDVAKEIVSTKHETKPNLRKMWAQRAANR